MADLEDFESIALPHMDELYSFAYYLVGEKQEAEDLVQQTLVKAMENFDSFEKGTNFKAWASRILKNLMIDRHRKKTPVSTDFESREPAAEEVKSPRSSTEILENEELMDKFFSDEVKSAILDLSEKYRVAILLNAVHGLSYQEIADVTDSPIGTVMSRLYRARKTLKEELEEFGKEFGYFRSEEASVETDE